MYDALLQSSLTCFLKVRFLSISIPSYVTSFELLILTLLIWTLKDLSSFFPRTINWNFPGLAFNELILNHSITPTRSVFRSEITFSMFFPTLCSVLLSAKLQTPDFLINKNKSFINMLKSKSPSKDPCGTPLFISCQEL